MDNENNANNKGRWAKKKERARKKSYRHTANKRLLDMFEAGIIDPTKVTRSALLNAASISALFITTEVGVAEIKSDEPQTPAMPGGMY